MRLTWLQHDQNEELVIVFLLFHLICVRCLHCWDTHMGNDEYSINQNKHSTLIINLYDILLSFYNIILSLR